jgi:hypothetical protein
MTRDETAPATKQDIRLLMDEIGRLYAANERWKDEIIDQVDERIAASEERVTGHFEVVAERRPACRNLPVGSASVGESGRG